MSAPSLEGGGVRSHNDYTLPKHPAASTDQIDITIVQQGDVPSATVNEQSTAASANMWLVAERQRPVSNTIYSLGAWVNAVVRQKGTRKHTYHFSPSQTTDRCLVPPISGIRMCDVSDMECERNGWSVPPSTVFFPPHRSSHQPPLSQKSPSPSEAKKNHG